MEGLVMISVDEVVSPSSREVDEAAWIFVEMQQVASWARLAVRELWIEVVEGFVAPRAF